MTLYPLLLESALHVKVWGGRRLATVMGKDLPTDEPYGESWELHDTARVANGVHAGRTIGDLLQEYGHALVGSKNNPAEGFPLLVKFLDAQDWLSVQVHPNDEQARELEGDPRGKTEAWVVLRANADARLVIGVQPGSTREVLAQAIRDNKLEDFLLYAEVKPGDTLFNNAGSIHALGPGILIYEIQQSSDVTYRLYDWGRMDLNGTPRPLHIEKGLQVSQIEQPRTLGHLALPDEITSDVFVCPYFITELYQFNDHGVEIDKSTLDVFEAITCIEGTLRFITDDTNLEITRGQSVLIPASVQRYRFEGTGRALYSYQNPNV